MIKISRSRLIWFVLAAIMTLAAPLYIYAQDAVGAYRPTKTDDGRLNIDEYMDGIGVYCADSTKTPWDTYENDGGFVVIAPHPEYPEGKELLWVPEEAIVAGIKQVEETGQYATLGQAEGTWFDPQPAIYYLPSGEFQLNVMSGQSPDRFFEFQWQVCRTVPKVTDDGCPPSKDPDGLDGCR